MPTFGIHVSADAHWYSRRFLKYFWMITSLYNISAQVNCFLRFFVIKFVIATSRISFCWRWTRALFSELKVGAHLHVCGRNEFKGTAHVYGRTEFYSTIVQCLVDYHIFCNNKFDLLLLLQFLLQLFVESSFTFYPIRFYEFIFTYSQVVLKRLICTST